LKELKAQRIDPVLHWLYRWIEPTVSLEALGQHDPAVDETGQPVRAPHLIGRVRLP
jgi:hypothetical protein